MAAETFDICSAFPATRVSQRPALSTPAGSPVVRARTINERELRIFTINVTRAPRALLARIQYLWRVITTGPSQPMNFTPDGESQIEVRFRQGTFTYSIASATQASFSVELEEVL